ncbi:Glutamyl-tRNA reductase [Deinococcus proteolyticus MRP]|uniref:Glutamyl-tRNA reductase n=1 Tax=Deinococcus proteolyticus (strain ATCC 35074 / DSM 20540 / JCM 6276 / NBRC 101906 / NCIMB 13154 / VKM Ac-1939 / CCM 2703 / MRP) TaxID=693977 RepID=F0RJK1_DEIPM|nr:MULTISPECIES: glutamyl-tRNA reductase [Deinococcus]ADY26571.1 Glutamyl-tRNA reductase [Deinococcus proteolyticus MRP]MCY1702695.1 glutamyl-tRNA reductase [Deinococcus sp. SL84]
MILTCPTAQSLLDAAPNQPRTLDFAVVGLNHQTAPVSVREQAAVPVQGASVLYGTLRDYADEVMVVATCNRTEVYLAGVHGSLEAAFNRAFRGEFGEHLYAYRERDAVHHLYRVVAGLDSLMVGETQIQGQVKRALAEAAGYGTTGTLLNKIVQGALATGKRVRSETGLSDRVVSVSSAAVELAREVLGDLQGRTALILGAGETAELTMTHLKAAGVSDVLVVNRTEERARSLADRWGGRTCPYQELQRALPQADVVIASAAAPHWVVQGEDAAQALQRRAGRPLFFFDISMPRILAPDIAKLPGAYLYNLDDLNSIVARNLEWRRSALPHAEAIIRESVAELMRWHLTREAQLRRHAAAVLAG